MNLLYVIALIVLNEVQAIFSFDFNKKKFCSATTTHCRCSRFFQQFGDHCCNSQQQLRFTFNLLHILGTFLHFFNLSISSMGASLSTLLPHEIVHLYTSNIQTTNVSSPQRFPVIIDVQTYMRQQSYTSNALR